MEFEVKSQDIKHEIIKHIILSVAPRSADTNTERSKQAAQLSPRAAPPDLRRIPRGVITARASFDRFRDKRCSESAF